MRNSSQITASVSEDHHTTFKGTEINKAFINYGAGLCDSNSRFFGSFLDRHSYELKAVSKKGYMSLEPKGNKPK